jgi:hypothetical protein
MRRLVTTLMLAATLVAGLATSSGALAHGVYVAPPRVGVYFGGAWGPYWGPGYPYYWGPRYYYPPSYYYYPPPAYYPHQPPVYIEREEQPAQPAPQESSQWWFYCPSAKAYYPYVRECPEPWQRVPAQPPPRS